jgi:hypothetical protein
VSFDVNPVGAVPTNILQDVDGSGREHNGFPVLDHFLCGVHITVISGFIILSLFF